MLIPTGTSVGTDQRQPGVIRSMSKRRSSERVQAYRSTAHHDNASDQTTTIIRSSNSTITAAEIMRMDYVEGLLSSNQQDVLMEEIVARYHENTKDAEVDRSKPGADSQTPVRQRAELRDRQTLNAEIVFVLALGNDSPAQLKERIELARTSFGGSKNITSALLSTS